MRIDRMLSITVMLLNKDRISARELADKFEVSIRTIYRDIDAINMAGIPIVSYSGNNGGFGIMENYRIDRQVLTLTDMFSILSALKGINTTLEDRELDQAIDKITSLVPKDKSDILERYFEQIVIDVLPWGYTKKQKDILKIIHKSIVNTNLISFEYRNSKGENVIRMVEPMTLLFKGYAWYLFAYCCLKEDYRLFRLSRIKDLKPLEQLFNRRKMSYTDFIKTDDAEIYMVDLVLKFSSKVRVRVEDYFQDDQISIQDNGDLIVKISFPEDEWVYSTLLSYGEYVEVLEPHHIREIIQEKAGKIMRIYNK